VLVKRTVHLVLADTAAHSTDRQLLSIAVLPDE